jgi:hypothetical protein
MAGLLDDSCGPQERAPRPSNSLLADPLMQLLQKAGMFPPGPLSQLMDAAYHQTTGQPHPQHNMLAQPGLHEVLGGAQPVRSAKDLGYIRPGQQIDPNAPGMEEVRRWLQQQSLGQNF